MTTNDFDAIRADIERTRANLSEDVNALADHTNPRNIAQSQVQKVKDKVGDARDAVFGRPEDPYDEGKVGDVKHTLADKAHDVKDAVTPDPYGPSTKQRVRGATRGHPLAAGLVAFGLGALVGGLAPSSRAEQQAAQQLKDKAQPLVENVKDAAKESAQNLKPAAQQAVGELKDHVSEAGQQLKEQASSEGQQVKQQLADSKENVAGQVSDSKDSVADTARHHGDVEDESTAAPVGWDPVAEPVVDSPFPGDEYEIDPVTGERRGGDGYVRG